MGNLWELRSFELSSFIKPASARWCHGIEMLPSYWPSERGIHWSLVDSLHKGPVIQSFDVFFNSQIASDLRHHDPHVACVTVMYDNLWHKPWYIHTHTHIYIYICIVPITTMCMFSGIHCTNHNHVHVFWAILYNQNHVHVLWDILYQSQLCACCMRFTVQSKPCSCFMRYTVPITTMCMFSGIHCNNHNRVHVFWAILHNQNHVHVLRDILYQSPPCACFMGYTVPIP